MQAEKTDVDRSTGHRKSAVLKCSVEDINREEALLLSHSGRSEEAKLVMGDGDGDLDGDVSIRPLTPWGGNWSGIISLQS